LGQPLTDPAADHMLKKKAYRDLKKQQRQSQQLTRVLPDTEKPKEKKMQVAPAPTQQV
jgi:hypothetical protein